MCTNPTLIDDPEVIEKILETADDPQRPAAGWPEGRRAGCPE